MQFVLWIARRLRLNGQASGANATGMAIAVTGVALAIIIMMATLAIVSGFKNQITERMMGFEPHISVLPAYDYESGESASFLSLLPELRSAIEGIEPNAKTALRFTLPGLIKTDSDFAGIYFQAYDSLHAYNFEKSSIVDGEWPDFSNNDNANKIVISRHQANELGLNIADKVYSYFFINDAIKMRRFEIAGIYDTGFTDYDNITAFAPLSTLQAIGNASSDEGTQLAITLPSINAIEQDAEALQMKILDMYQTGEMEKVYPVDNVKHTGAMFFNWLELLDTNVIVIFILMACVAGFTLVSSMFILVLDRISTIGLLRSLGATKRQIRDIFSSLAMKAVGLGMVIGNIIGIGLLLIQKSFHIMKLDPEMYYLPYVPVEINLWWIIILNFCVAIIAWGLLAIPAQVAANTSPASTMRYE